MEQNQTPPLFGLGIDPAAKSHLFDAARWAKFLAVIGFIACALIVIGGIFSASIIAYFSNYDRYDRLGDMNDYSKAFAIAITISCILVALLYFFPCLFLFNFASKMKAALISNDQNTLNTSFQNLKKTFRYIGVLTIIILAFYIVFFAVALAGGGAGTRY